MHEITEKMFIVLLTSIVNPSKHSKCLSLNNQKYLLLLTYILMNTVKNYTTIHLRLNLRNVLEVVIHLMTFLKKYVFQIKQKT